MTNVLFNRLIADMNKKITRNEKHDGRSQLKLMTDLVEAERKFKDLLIADPKGEDMYLSFIEFIWTFSAFS